MILKWYEIYGFEQRELPAPSGVTSCKIPSRKWRRSRFFYFLCNFHFITEMGYATLYFKEISVTLE